MKCAFEKNGRENGVRREDKGQGKAVSREK